MHRPDRFDDGPDPSELPDLPIPRPGEGPAEPAQAHAPIAPPRLGGGASFTAASEDDPPVGASAPAPLPIPADVELIEVDRARLETERFTWNIAAQLTAGMLSNPERNHASVKDAMAMFDQFLQEVNAYSRIASEFDLLSAANAERRRHHTEYFQGAPADTTAEAAPQSPAPAAHGPAPAPQVPPPLQQLPPEQPRPMSGYQALPPGARSYVPGSMAGAPPPLQDQSGDDEADLAA